MRIAVADNPDGRILPDARTKILRHFKTQISDEYPIDRLERLYCPVMCPDMMKIIVGDTPEVRLLPIYNHPEVKEIRKSWW